MKTIAKVILPVLAFTMASAGAISTNDAKVKEAEKPVLITGFIQNPSPSNCLDVAVECSPINTGQICMTSEATPRQVWRKNIANQCSLNLYKVIH